MRKPFSGSLIAYPKCFLMLINLKINRGAKIRTEVVVGLQLPASRLTVAMQHTPSHHSSRNLSATLLF